MYPRYRFRRSALFLLVVTYIVLFGGCSREPERLAMPETPVLGVQDRYALVLDYYARMHVTPDRNAAIASQARKGDILSIVSRTPDNSWIEVRRIPGEGWIEAENVRLFSSRELALNARRMMDL